MDGMPRASNEKESEIRGTMSKGNILVVDDDKNLLELVKMRLESADYEVTTAPREEDAVEAVKSQVFDLSALTCSLSIRMEFL